MRGNWGIELVELGFILMEIDYILTDTPEFIRHPLSNWSSFTYLTQK